VLWLALEKLAIAAKSDIIPLSYAGRTHLREAVDAS
jgi:hypothetical protein